MTSITVPMDPDTASAFARASTDEQQKLRLLLSLQLRALTTAPQKSLDAIMDEIGQKAAAQGLTPQILDSLLHGE
jgi:hypothetical protein